MKITLISGISVFVKKWVIIFIGDNFWVNSDYIITDFCCQ